jgi:hypothetical protein
MATIFPAPNRPSTALQGVGDSHDDNVYSALVVAHGGVGIQTIFLGGIGTPIPALTGTAIVAANIPTHYQSYTTSTTNIQQSGQLGNTVGDFSVRAVGVTLDQTSYTAGTGVPRVWGATPWEVADALSKIVVEVKLSNKRRIMGPAWAFPQLGGPMGFSVASGSALVGNGLFATGRRIASRFEIARNDTLTVDVTANAALAFSDTSFATTHAGQATLMTVLMIGTANSDVR